jgi:hypothetical protein
MSFGFIYVMDGLRIYLVPFGSPGSLLAPMHNDRPLVRRYLHAQICWVKYCFEGVQRPSTNDCIIGILHINNVEDNLLCPCIVNIAEGDRHSYLAECHNPSSSEVTEGCVASCILSSCFCICLKAFAKMMFAALPVSTTTLWTRNPLMTQDITIASL